MRTLLIAVTVLAILMATFGVRYVRLQIERSVVAKFEGQATIEGGHVTELKIQPDGPGEGRLIDNDLKQLNKLPELRWLALQFAWVTDAGLVHLKPLRHLEELYLGHSDHLEPKTDLTKIFLGTDYMGSDVTTSAGYQRVKNDLWSHMLVIRNVQITDAGMEHVGAIESLRVLSLENTAVADEGLRHLQGLKNLEELDLRMTYVTNAGLKWLTSLPRLQRLKISNARYISDGAIPHLCQMPALRELSLPPGVTDVGLKQLAALKQLEHLDVTQCTISEAGFQELSRSLPKCKMTITVEQFRPVEPNSVDTLGQELIINEYLRSGPP